MAENGFFPTGDADQLCTLKNKLPVLTKNSPTATSIHIQDIHKMLVSDAKDISEISSLRKTA